MIQTFFKRIFGSSCDKPFSFPPPFKRMLAINSDVEWTDWEAQINLMRLFASRELETSFSFWVWCDPKVTWRLLDKKNRPTEEAEKALYLMRSGVLDTVHSFGGRTHQGGCDYIRSDVEKAYAYLKSQNITLSIYTNHGSTKDIQNIAGDWASYQQGDQPDSEIYHLDITRDFGCKFFWCDPDYVVDQPCLAPKVDTEDSLFIAAQGRDGTPYIRFRRFMGEGLLGGPSLDNLHTQVEQLLNTDQEGYSVVYQHLGVYRTEEGRPKQANTKQPFPETLKALGDLKAAQDRGEILVTTTTRLLVHAALMTAKPWVIKKTFGRIQVTFDKEFTVAGVKFEVTEGVLTGWALPGPKDKITAYIGSAPLELQEFTIDHKKYTGFPWERREPALFNKFMSKFYE